jgi:hypothetical protein
MENEEITTSQKLHFFCNCAELLIFSVFQLYLVYSNRGNLLAALSALEPLLAELPVTVRILLLVWYRKQFKTVLEYLRRNFNTGK